MVSGYGRLGVVFVALSGAFWAPAAAVAVPATAAPVPATVAGWPGGGPPLDPAPPATPTGHFHTWSGTPNDVVGGIAYSPGEIIVTSSPFNDHGGDTNPNDADPSDLFPNPSTGANADQGNAGTATGGANGDYKYPVDPVYGNNAADIVETRLAADAASWYLLVRLNMLNDPELTTIEARIDGHVLIAHGQQGTFDGNPVDVVGDSGQSLFEVRVPRSVFDPGARVHPMFVAAGLWDAAAQTWRYPAAGNPPYFDLAYSPTEGMDSYWRDRIQSMDIVNGSFATHYFDVDFGALARGGCPAGKPCPAYSGPTQGLFSRVFRSGQPLGRGVGPQTRYGQTSVYIYRSPTQPYAIYVPKHQTGALVLLLHFLGGNYMSYPLTSMPGVASWAEKLGVIVAMPLARGGGGWYEGEAEKDVFEVWRDVATHYRVDPERVYLTGMSMGGYGTWRLGQLYPDMFARGIIWSGPVVPDTFWFYPAPPIPPSCASDQPRSCGFNLTDLFGSTRNLPLFVLHGGADELVTSTGAEYWMGLYGSTGDATYRYAFYPDRRHETSYPGTTGDWVLQWLDGLPPRQTSPVHVTYKLIRSYFQPQFGITYDGAYWAHGLELAPGADTGSIDANRSTLPATTTVLPDRYGVDALGLYRLRGSDVTPAPAVPNWVHVSMTHLAKASLDTARMQWSAGSLQHIVGDTDTPVDLSLGGGYAPGAVVRGAPFTFAGGALRLQLPAGSFDVTVDPAAGDVPIVPEAPLAAMLALAALGVVVAGYGWRRRTSSRV